MLYLKGSQLACLQYSQKTISIRVPFVTITLNPLSPKIDFYVDLLICETSWARNHKFMLLSKILQETYYL